MLKVLMPSITELVSLDYNDIKSKETEALIENALSSVTPSVTPTLMQISGIPGSGKSTYCSMHKSKEYLYLSFDVIMTSLKGYQQELLINGNKKAFEKYEMIARTIGYELLNRAIAKKVNIMLEHSGTNKAHVELFQNIKKKGYNTLVNFILCDTSLAIKRTKERALKINRHVPEQLILDRAKGIENYIKTYKTIASNVNLLDGTNNFAPLKKI